MKRESKAIKEFRRRARRSAQEAPGNSAPPSCMYWIRHCDAMLIIAAIDGSVQSPKIPADLQKRFTGIRDLLAKQWIKYDQADTPPANTKLEARMKALDALIHGRAAEPTE